MFVAFFLVNQSIPEFNKFMQFLFGCIGFWEEGLDLPRRIQQLLYLSDVLRCCITVVMYPRVFFPRGESFPGDRMILGRFQIHTISIGRDLLYFSSLLQVQTLSRLLSDLIFLCDLSKLSTLSSPPRRAYREVSRM